MQLAARLIEEIREEFPGFRIVPKGEDRLSRAIDRALRFVTFGRQSGYLTSYHTVIGDTLYVPSAWDTTSDVDQAIVLRHERVHLRQRRRLGLPVMAFLYFVPFFPLGLAYGRARLEWEAYTETLRATAELAGSAAARSPELRARIVRRFTGPDYAWMWPFERQVQGWYDAALGALESSQEPPRKLEPSSQTALKHGERAA
ncbi:MAG: hypothetical protein IPI67_16445 [Myxococcales bacterium]|nr:hypothetical protein [Myxococcales bacterium]